MPQQRHSICAMKGKNYKTKAKKKKNISWYALLVKSKYYFKLWDCSRTHKCQMITTVECFTAKQQFYTSDVCIQFITMWITVLLLPNFVTRHILKAQIVLYDFVQSQNVCKENWQKDAADEDTSWVDGSSIGSAIGNIVLQLLK